MELKDVVGIWKKYDKGSTWYSITTYRFKSNGTYTQTDETSGMAGTRLFEQQGTFKIIGPLKIEMEYEEHYDSFIFVEKQVRKVRRVVSILSLGSKVV